MRLPIFALLVFAGLAIGSLFCLDYRKPRSARRPAPPIFGVQPPPPEAVVLERRTRAKSLLARRVIAERIPLLDAAEMFREANGEEGMRLVATVRGRSVREKLCRQVISFVCGAETEMEEDGHTPAGSRASVVLEKELGLRIAAGEFPPDPGCE
jgi:hypothetical protein